MRERRRAILFGMCLVILGVLTGGSWIHYTITIGLAGIFIGMNEYLLRMDRR